MTGPSMAPIDAAARDGRSHIVTGGAYYAVARWDAERGRWVYPGSRHPLDFEPTRYRPEPPR